MVLVGVFEACLVASLVFHPSQQGSLSLILLSSHPLILDPGSTLSTLFGCPQSANNLLYLCYISFLSSLLILNSILLHIIIVYCYIITDSSIRIQCWTLSQYEWSTTQKPRFGCYFIDGSGMYSFYFSIQNAIHTTVLYIIIINIFILIVCNKLFWCRI